MFSLPECTPEGIIDIMYADDTTLTVSANDATVVEENELFIKQSHGMD